MRSLAAEAAAAGVTVELKVAPELAGARVVGTPQELSFILENLIANAVCALEGARERRLIVDAARDADAAIVAVEDTGKGVHPERHEEIFRRGASERVGGGQGLAGSRDILARRGGTIRLVRSAPGEGSVFEVKLKIAG